MFDIMINNYPLLTLVILTSGIFLLGFVWGYWFGIFKNLKEM
jgi:hypothetical protein